LADSFDSLAASFVALADARSSGHVEMSMPIIDVGRVIASNPVRVRVLGSQLTLEDEDFVTAHGYTPSVGHVVLVLPVYSGGFFIMRVNA
jgi:hypothetical protein